MLDLVARFADEWNWWGYDETPAEMHARLAPICERLDEASSTIGRAPASLVRTLDVYSVVPPGFPSDSASMVNAVTGSVDDIAEVILGLADLGFSEVRLDLSDKTPSAVEAMAPVVDIVHGAR